MCNTPLTSGLGLSVFFASENSESLLATGAIPEKKQNAVRRERVCGDMERREGGEGERRRKERG